MASLAGKTAVVTGAARGIGRAIAERLAGDGAALALCDLEEEWLQDTAEALRGAGAKARCYAVDVGDSEAVNAVVERIRKDFDSLDILVNNAGITRDALLPRMRDDDWDAVLQVNLKGAFLFSRAVARDMMRRRSGSIVNVASIVGLIGNAGQCNYSASKAGLIGLTKSAARELAKRNIRVNAVAPGFIRTRMTEELSAEVKTKMFESIPLARFGEPEEVASVVAFLAGEDAAYVTGQVVTASGGMVT